VNAWEQDRVWQRLFGYQHAFDHPFVSWAVIAVIALLGLSGILIELLRRTGAMSSETYRDAHVRWRSWTVLSLAIMLPTLLGAAWTIAAVGLLSLACFYEYAKATGLLGQRLICGIVVSGIVLVTLAAADHYERLFFAAGPLIVVLIAVATIASDRPQGYVQRVSLAAWGFLMFGVGLGYVANFANVADLGNGADYRAIVFLVISGVAMNDVLAYCVGKTLGGRKLVPHTSPGKTVSGSLGAIVLATPMIAVMAHYVLRGTPADRLDVLVTLGVGISLLGQLGDLVISSIKRDVGIKDTGHVIPGHGGILDRFDSLILVPPALFHYLSLQLGPLAADEPARIFSGG
jgi:phosphatidate cytidylyltransferase